MVRILFCFLLFIAAFSPTSAQAVELESGTRITSHIAPGGTDIHTFEGVAGQGIMINAYSSAYNVRIRAFTPTGTQISNAINSTVLALPADGTYSVQFTYGTAAQSGNYDISYLQSGKTTSGGEVQSGINYTGSLQPNGIASFYFDGVAGQYVRFQVRGPSTNVPFRFFRPDGSFGGIANNAIATSLPQTGRYTIAFTYSGTHISGDYSFDNYQGGESTKNGSLFNGLTRNGNIDVLGVDSYKFTAVAGNNIYITTTGATTRTVTLMTPDGQSYGWFNNAITRINIPTTGTYSVTVSSGGSNNFGPYTITVNTPPAPESSDPEESPSDLAYNTEDGCAVPAPQPFAGNPINFDIGYKTKTEADYRGGRLAFTRLYRSDSTWTDNTIGTLWRHNYARTLTTTGTTAEIVDGSGAKTSYTLDGSNWIPDNPGTTAKFNTVAGGYSYTLIDNTREVYDSNKRLTRIEYLGSTALNLAYDGSGRLQTVSDENGRSLTFTYASGRVATVVTPEGTFTYTYDGNGNLTEVAKPGSVTREYHYENVSYVNALTGITDENGQRFATYAYDGQGRAISSKYIGDVDSYEVTYGAVDSVKVTNPLGKETTYYFIKIQGLRRIAQVDGHASANCVASNRYYTYYDNGLLKNKTDWEGNTTEYIRNARGLVTQTTEAMNTPQQRVTNTEYETNFNLPKKITTANRETSYAYDAFGRMTSASVKDLNSSETRTTTYTYYANTTDGSGNVILGRADTATNPLGAVTKYTYNADLLVQTVTQAHGEAYAQTTSYTYDAAKRIATITEPNTAVTALTYDALSRILTSTRANGTALAAVTTFTYDDNGNVTKAEMPNGTEVSYTYDNAQRLTGVTDDLGNTITYTLDDAGNTTKTEYKDATPALKYTQSQMYDELSRLIKDINAASDESIYAYDKNSNLTSFTDANTNATGYAYDALQRLVKETDALSGETDYAYNTLDDNTGVTDARDNTTDYVYNAFGEVTEEASPDRGYTTYIYDLAGNLTTLSTANGIVSEYTYDDLNRVTAVTHPLDTSENTAYAYDSCTNGAGRLCSVTDASGATAYAYDLLGRITTVTETRGALSFTTGYAYDLAGVLTGVTLPSGRTVTYALNGNAEVTSVTAPVAGTPVTLASTISYLPFGPATSMTYGNALAFTAAYDQNYWPTSRAVGGIFSNAYTTDDNGNITGIGGTDFGYDALNRLDEEDSGSAATYTYDAVSNRLTKVSGSTTTTTVPAGSNKISAVGANAYTYDAVGNITGDGTRTYVWDSLGHLREVKISASTVGTYTYNASHQRTKKIAGGNTTHYVYGAGGLLYGEYTGAGALVREYIYLNGEPLAQVNAGSPETVTYLHTDHLGTPKYGTNAAGAQVWAWAPDAFGNGAPTGSATVNLRMPGQYFDAESGIFYNWNRYYNPEIGRYISSDPIGLEGGINTFLYAGANPVMMMDPQGLNSFILNEKISDNGVNALGLNRDAFQSILDKHGPNTNRLKRNSTFYPQYIKDIDTFQNSIIIPATGTQCPSTDIMVKPYFRSPSDTIDIIANIGTPIGLTDGVPTNFVLIRARTTGFVTGFMGLYDIIGAYPVQAPAAQ